MPCPLQRRWRLAALLLLASNVNCVCVHPRIDAPPDTFCDQRWASRSWLWSCLDGRRTLVVQHTCEGPCPPTYSRFEGPCGTPLPEEERYLQNCRPGAGTWPP